MNNLCGTSILFLDRVTCKCGTHWTASSYCVRPAIARQLCAACEKIDKKNMIYAHKSRRKTLKLSLLAQTTKRFIIIVWVFAKTCFHVLFPVLTPRPPLVLPLPITASYCRVHANLSYCSFLFFVSEHTPA